MHFRPVNKKNANSKLKEKGVWLYIQFFFLVTLDQRETTNDNICMNLSENKRDLYIEIEMNINEEFT